MEASYFDLHHGFLAERPIPSLSNHESRWLANEIMQRHWAAYSDPKHVDHELVSGDIRALHERIAATTPDGDQPV